MWRKYILLAVVALVPAGLVATRLAVTPDDDTVMAAPAAIAAAPSPQAPAPLPRTVLAPAANNTIPPDAAVRLVDGRIEAHLRGARLPAAVAAIAHAAAVELVGVEHLPDVPVAVDLDGVPAAEALLRLTAGCNSAFEYRDGRLLRLTLVAESPNQARAEPPLDAAQLDRLDPQQRGDAVEALASGGGDGARALLVHALADTDEQVRLRALEQAQLVRGLAPSTEMLQDVLLRDASETVRFKALDVLATSPVVDAAALTIIARGAESDPSGLVRNRAAQLREQLESSNQRQSQDGR